MFESRQTAESRDLEYETLGPFIHEREVGINCGQLATEGGEKAHGTSIIDKDPQINGEGWAPFSGDNGNCAAMIGDSHVRQDDMVEGSQVTNDDVESEMLRQ
jgi:hypothetical protein